MLKQHAGKGGCKQLQQRDTAFSSYQLVLQDNAAHQSHLMAKYRNLASEYSRLETQTSRDSQTMVANEQEKEAAKAKAL
jgi:hypothetical protein